MNTVYDTVIVANGEFPKMELPLNVLERANRIICCDGAANNLMDYGMMPDYVIGDFDSMTQETKEKLNGKLLHVAEQDSNDLTKAVRFCIEKGYNNLAILGATGKREDHTLGNIALLNNYMDILDSPVMVTDYGIFHTIKEQTIFRAIPGQQISLFSFDRDVSITTKGLKYPLENSTVSQLWQATLNEAVGNEFEIIPNGKLMVFVAYEVKRAK